MERDSTENSELRDQKRHKLRKKRKRFLLFLKGVRPEEEKTINSELLFYINRVYFGINLTLSNISLKKNLRKQKRICFRASSSFPRIKSASSRKIIIFEESCSRDATF
jgi:hypothetical protein